MIFQGGVGGNTRQTKHTKTYKASIYYRTEMLSYWPDICHSQTRTKHGLPLSARGESPALHNEGWALRGQSCSQGVPASVQRAGECAFDAKCPGHWRHFLLKRQANFG